MQLVRRGKYKLVLYCWTTYYMTKSSAQFHRHIEKNTLLIQHFCTSCVAIHDQDLIKVENAKALG